MSQFITVNVKDVISKIEKFLVVSVYLNEDNTVSIKHSTDGFIAVDNTFEDIINQLKGQ